MSLSLNQVFQADVKMGLYSIKVGCCNQMCLKHAKEHDRFFWLWSWEICWQQTWQYLGRINVHLFLILHKNMFISCTSMTLIL